MNDSKKEYLNNLSNLFKKISIGVLGITMLPTVFGSNLSFRDPNGKKHQFLALDNTTAYTPTLDYHPATKKYVVDSLTPTSGDFGFWNRTSTTIIPATDNDIVDLRSEISNNPDITGTITEFSMNDNSPYTYSDPGYVGYGQYSIRIYGYDSVTDSYSSNYLTTTVDPIYYYSVYFNLTITGSNYTEFKIFLKDEAYGGEWWETSTTGTMILGGPSNNVTDSDSIIIPTGSYATDYPLLSNGFKAEKIYWNLNLCPIGEIIGNTLISGDLNVDKVTATDDITTTTDVIADKMYAKTEYQLDNMYFKQWGIGSGFSIGPSTSKAGSSSVSLLGGYNSTGSNSFFLGIGSGSNVSGHNNIGIGDNSVNGIGSATRMLGIGSSSLYQATGSDNAIGIGPASGFQNINSSYSLFIGNYSGFQYSNNPNTFIVSQTSSGLSVANMPTKSFLYGKTDLNGNVSNMYLRVNASLKQNDDVPQYQGSADDFSQLYDGSDEQFDISSGDYVFNTGAVQGKGGFKSSDGSTGVTQSLTFGGGSTGDVATITVKNGLITGVTLVP